MISFGCVDSYAKIFLIFYPPLENSTTRIALTPIMYNARVGNGRGHYTINVEISQNIEWSCLFFCQILSIIYDTVQA